MASRSENAQTESQRLLSDKQPDASRAPTQHVSKNESLDPPVKAQRPYQSSENDLSASDHQGRKRVAHYSSLSVDYQVSPDQDPIHGSAQIFEIDMGEKNDFWNIHVDFIWKPRRQKDQNFLAKPDIKHHSPVKVSVDDFLTIRNQFHSNRPCVTIHLQGGKLLGDFLFPNGPDAAMAFVTALQAHVKTIPLRDDLKPGSLYAVERKPRMRRAAPSLTSLPADQNRLDEDFSKLLDNLSLRAPGNSERNRLRPNRNTRHAPASAPQSKDFGMLLLSQFAKVTQAARDVGEDLSVLLDDSKRRAEAVRKERERTARRRALDIYADIVASTDVEGELPPRLLLDKKRGTPVRKQVWEQSFDKNGVLSDSAVMTQAIFSGGVEKTARKHIWPFILGLYPWVSTTAERSQIKQRMEDEYRVLKDKWISLQISAEEEDAASRAASAEAITTDRRKRVSKAHADYLEIDEQIAKDIVRTDRHVDLYKQENAPATLALGTILNIYATYDNRITYCQGMSDFLSPILHVLGIENEALAFWCFEALMRRIEGNFRIDQSGMRRQLSQLKNLIEIADGELAAFFRQSDPDYYCCFRWILVRFKRELTFDATARLWEVIWTRQVGGDDFHIFVAGALLIAHRKQLLSLPKGAFDSLLRYINDMSMRIDVDFAIREAELCFRTYGEFVELSTDT